MRSALIALILWSTSAMAGAAAPAGSPGFSDEPSGVGCTHHSIGGRFAWKRKLGDWVDSAGTAYGEQAYGSARAGGSPLSEGLSLDITTLVRQWLDGSRPNTGILLRALSGTATLEIPSREAEKGVPPVLEIEWAQGPADALRPAVDVTLDCSTVRGIGKSKRLRVAPELNTLLVYEVPARPAAQLMSARLRIVAQKLYGRSLTIGAFSPQPPWATPTVRADGLAARYPGDAGIARDPDVLFVADFERADWLRDWNRLTRSVVAQVGSEEGNGFRPLSGKAIRTTLKQGGNTALNLRYLFAKHHGEEPEEIYFRYYLRLGDDWSPDVDGGKLPGFGGTYGKAGWGLRRSDGTNGWSARGGFRPVMRQQAGGPQLTPIGSYVYQADDKDEFGSYWGWSEGRGGLLENGRWYAVEQYLKMNTPGQHDGEFRAWIDGRLVRQRSGLFFRTVPDLRIESIWLNVYHGGTAKSPRDMSLYIDNLVIARRYIGPMADGKK